MDEEREGCRRGGREGGGTERWSNDGWKRGFGGRVSVGEGICSSRDE